MFFRNVEFSPPLGRSNRRYWLHLSLVPQHFISKYGLTPLSSQNIGFDGGNSLSGSKHLIVIFHVQGKRVHGRRKRCRFIDARDWHISMIIILCVFVCFFCRQIIICVFVCGILNHFIFVSFNPANLIKIRLFSISNLWWDGCCVRVRVRVCDVAVECERR